MGIFRKSPEKYLPFLRRTLEEVLNRISAIESQLQQADFPRVAQSVHSLKGMSGSVGLLAVYELSVQLETYLKTTPAPDAAAIRSEYLQRIIAERAAIESVVSPDKHMGLPGSS